MPEKRTVRQAVKRAVRQLQRHGVPNARLDAEVLLAHVLGTDRYKLYMESESPLSARERALFRELVERRGKREPLQHLTGRQEFWSLGFSVDRHVLIPRPETELLVETALEKAGKIPGGPHLIDMGSGCGNMAVSLALELPSARITAVDISGRAALCTRKNAFDHGVGERVEVICADLFSAFGGALTADIIVTNPPYIDPASLGSLQPEVSKHEPKEALDGGRGGLEIIRELLASAAGYLRTGGHLILEAGEGQAEDLKRLACQGGKWLSHEIAADHAGHPRVHILEKK